MASLFNSNEYIKEAVEIFENSSKTEQKQLLRILKLQKARKLAKKIDRGRMKKKVSDEDFANVVHKVRTGQVGK